MFFLRRLAHQVPPPRNATYLLNLAVLTFLVGCGASPTHQEDGCSKDVDCKGDRICMAGMCGTAPGNAGGTGQPDGGDHSHDAGGTTTAGLCNGDSNASCFTVGANLITLDQIVCRQDSFANKWIAFLFLGGQDMGNAKFLQQPMPDDYPIDPLPPDSECNGKPPVPLGCFQPSPSHAQLTLWDTPIRDRYVARGGDFTVSPGNANQLIISWDSVAIENRTRIIGALPRSSGHLVCTLAP